MASSEELPYRAENVVYTALFLTEASWELLLSSCTAQGLEWEGELSLVSNPHVTLAFHPSELSCFGRRGREVSIRVLRIHTHEKLHVARVEILDPDIASVSQGQHHGDTHPIPHITIATTPDTPPSLSNALLMYTARGAGCVPLTDLVLHTKLGDWVVNVGRCCGDVTPETIAPGLRRVRGSPSSPAPVIPKLSRSSPVSLEKNQPGKVLYNKLLSLPADPDGLHQLQNLLPSPIQSGADFRVYPEEGPILHLLTKKGWKEGVRYLIEDLGFDVNAMRAKDGCTPLHLAAYARNEDMEVLLVELGADPLIKNRYGEVPMMSKTAGKAAETMAAKTKEHGRPVRLKNTRGRKAHQLPSRPRSPGSLPPTPREILPPNAQSFQDFISSEVFKETYENDTPEAPDWLVGGRTDPPGGEGPQGEARSQCFDEADDDELMAMPSVSYPTTESFSFNDPEDGAPIVFYAVEGGVAYTVGGEARPSFAQAVFERDEQGIYVDFPALDRSVGLPDEETASRLADYFTANGVVHNYEAFAPPAAGMSVRCTAPQVSGYYRLCDELTNGRPAWEHTEQPDCMLFYSPSVGWSIASPSVCLCNKHHGSYPYGSTGWGYEDSGTWLPISISLTPVR